MRVPELGSSEGEWGECVGGVSVWRRGVKEGDVKMWLWAWGPEFIVGLAVKGDSEGILKPEWRVLDMEALVREKAATT